MDAGVRFAERRAVRLADGSWLTHGYLHQQAEPVRHAIAESVRELGGAVACLVRTSETLTIALIASLTSAPSVTFLDATMPSNWNRDAIHTVGARTLLADRSTYEYARSICGIDDKIILVDSPKDYASDETIEVPKDGTLTIFTSGSTGHPKGVLRPYGAMAHTSYNIARRFECNQDDVMLYVGSPAHVGTLNDVLLCVLNGYSSVPMQLLDLNLRSVTKLIKQLGINKIAMPPSLMRLFLGHVGSTERMNTQMTICSSGEALLRSDVRLFYEVFSHDSKLWQSYGSTEAGHMVAGFYGPEDADGSGPLPLNHPASGVEIEIIDDDGSPVSIGETGQIRVRTPALADGYTSTAAESSGFGEDERGRYFMTGDRAQLLQEDVFVIEGRADRQINRNGRRVELGEIESTILETPGWGEACAALVPDGPNRRTLMAMVSPTDFSKTDILSLRARLHRELPAFAVPAQIVRVSALPRTSSGKVDLGEVQRSLAAQLGSLRTGAGDLPQGPTENWVADAWQAVLGVEERPTRDIAFDAFGGDSLNAVDLCLRFGEKFDIEVGIDFITANRTIASQATAIQRAASGTLQSSRVVPLRSNGKGPCIVLLPGAGGHAWVYLSIADELDCACDLLALNMQFNAPDDLCIEQLTATVLDAIETMDRERPLYFVGYSYGSLIACSLVQACRDQGVSVAGLGLIDPSPIGRRSPAERAMRSLRTTFSKKLNHRQRTKNAQLLDQQIDATRKEIARRYRPERTNVPNIPCSVLCTESTMGELRAHARLFQRPLNQFDLHLVSDMSHLDLMRRRGARQVAEWLCAMLKKRDPEQQQVDSA